MGIATGSSVSSARKLTVWAGRLIVAVSLMHLLFFLVRAVDQVPGWFSGDMWVNEPFDAPISQSQAEFWTLLGSFAVPLLLLGAVIVRSAKEDRPLPAYVTWTITVWVVVCALVLEPAGFPFLLVPAGLLIAAEVLRKRT